MPQSSGAASAPASGWSGNDLLLVTAATLGILAIVIMVVGGAALADFPPAFLPVVGGIFAGVAVATRKGWAYLTSGIILALLPILMVVLFGGWHVFLNPLAGPEQAAVVFLSATAVFGLWGGIGGFRAARAGTRVAAGAFLGTRAGSVAVALAALVVGMTFTGYFGSEQANGILSTGSGIAPEATATFTMKGFEFPAAMSIPAGKIVEATVVNADPGWHTFTYNVNGVEHSYHIVGGGTTKFLMKIDTPGEVKVRCVPHSDGYDSGMVAKLNVTAAP